IGAGIIAFFFQSVVREPPYPAVFFPLLILGYSIYFAAAPACIAEQAGSGALALPRSGFLTKGHRWQIFGAFILFFGCDAIISDIAQTVMSWVDAADTERLIASYLVQVVFLSFNAVLAAVLYHQLRLAKDGADVASVFD